ncbi:hypothetical protein THAOC_25180, partial [Thalassiosira oceanica]
HGMKAWTPPFPFDGGDPGPADWTLPSHFLLDSVSRPPLVQATSAERMAAGQVKWVLRLLEAYPARLFGDDGSIHGEHNIIWPPSCTAAPQ